MHKNKNVVEPFERRQRWVVKNRDCSVGVRDSVKSFNRGKLGVVVDGQATACVRRIQYFGEPISCKPIKEHTKIKYRHGTKKYNKKQKYLIYANFARPYRGEFSVITHPQARTRRCWETVRLLGHGFRGEILNRSDFFFN